MPADIGPIIFDVQGVALNAEDREILQHPLIGGIILFARNFESAAQVTQLCQSIRKARKRPILITVDQEGGRVQRFRNDFTTLPSMGKIGKLYEKSGQAGLALAEICGWLMAIELLAVGVDLSFAPVLDLDSGVSQVIGDRAFHASGDSIFELASALTKGMRDAGMSAVGKHFPGHGSVEVDSHIGLPIDHRDLEKIVEKDLVPFIKMIDSGMEGLMAAHILFPNVDSMPVSFSRHWLHDILRKKMHFKGMVFSDALDMHGADVAGAYPERVEIALSAGCDMTLVCNSRAGVIKTLDNLPKQFHRVASDRFETMRGKFSVVNKGSHPAWQEKQKLFYVLEKQAE